ncbi:hypothetical protein SISNIDRAFT_488173 [Sistotremastrum niveocremeum HHB9708]|uniref:Uncharacterized protein n=1 Tax=Sistotremastrum niveocremeum HHB9708 TaxID=1314777 RepID=A0A164RJ01_9AGAM|nr:hypothetical protein SISNIDRAFT_488173 [Sistotremastrum niveocremeum HHB9708]
MLVLLDNLAIESRLSNPIYMTWERDDLGRSIVTVCNSAMDLEKDGDCSVITQQSIFDMTICVSAGSDGGLAGCVMHAISPSRNPSSTDEASIVTGAKDIDALNLNQLFGEIVEQSFAGDPIWKISGEAESSTLPAAFDADPFFEHLLNEERANLGIDESMGTVVSSRTHSYGMQSNLQHSPSSHTQPNMFPPVLRTDSVSDDSQENYSTCSEDSDISMYTGVNDPYQPQGLGDRYERSDLPFPIAVPMSLGSASKAQSQQAMSIVRDDITYSRPTGLGPQNAAQSHTPMVQPSAPENQQNVHCADGGFSNGAVPCSCKNPVHGLNTKEGTWPTANSGFVFNTLVPQVVMPVM